MTWADKGSSLFLARAKELHDRNQDPPDELRLEIPPVFVDATG